MYNKRILAAGLAASIGALALIGVLLAASGVAYAVPLSGVGGFTVEAEEIRADDMFIYPGVSDTSEREAQPVAVTEMQSTEIDGLKLSKTLDVSSMPGLDGQMRIVISQSGNETVTTGQQMLKYSKLSAEESQFSGQVIDENPSSDPSRKFDITAPTNETVQGRTVDISGDNPGLVLRDAEIQAHYLAVSSISIPDLQFNVHYDEGGGDGGTSGETGTDDQSDQPATDAGDAAGQKKTEA